MPVNCESNSGVLIIEAPAEPTSVKLDNFDHYEKFDQRSLSHTKAVAWLSRVAEDKCWDAFLESTALGQFQQSTIWSRAKEPGGWRPIRIVVTVDNEIVAGFQILSRSFWWGKIGYLSKGPVVLPQWGEAADYVIELLRTISQAEGFRAVIVQPPDLCHQMPDRLDSAGFDLDVSGEVIDATWVIDLRGGFAAVEQGMNGEARRKIRQGVNRGVKVRDGDSHELGAFFELMLMTCQRQQVAPNPPDMKHLRAFWNAAHPTGRTRLYFSEFEGKPLTGYLDFAFGKTLKQWKKGWNSTEGQRNPNDVSTFEALKWACARGYEFYDFCGFDRKMALAIMQGEQLTENQLRSRYMFFTRFGGFPRLLPPSRVYFPNRLARHAYRLKYKSRLAAADRPSFQ
jgi:GNAT acetyltransferase-like protein